MEACVELFSRSLGLGKFATGRKRPLCHGALSAYYPPMAAPRVILVDGSSLIYRAFFAIPGNLRTAAGLPTNASLGFAQMFRKVLAGRTPTYGAVVFDAPGPTFRAQKYPDYKAQRPPMADDLRAQLPHIDRLVHAHAFPLLRMQGYEADDLIGTITRRALEAGCEVYIVSGDKDFAQLIGPNVRMIDTLRDVTYDPELCFRKWGVRPEQMIDWLALTGDKSDNIPGVPGIGAKGAAKLLADFGDLETVLASTDQLKGRQQTTLRENAELARLCYDLATIDQHVPITETLEDLRLSPPDPEPLREVLMDLQFYSLLPDDQRGELADGDVETDFEVVQSMAGLSALYAELKRLPAGQLPSIVPVLDYEPPVIAPLVGFAIGLGGGKAKYVPLKSPEVSLGVAGLRGLRGWLADPEMPKCGHDLKRLIVALLRAEMVFEGAAFDTMLGSFLIDPTGLIPHRLEQCTKRFIQRTVRPSKDVIGAGKKLRAFSECPVEDVAAWACHIADLIATLTPEVAKHVQEHGQTAQLLKFDLPLSVVLAKMEVAGVRVDKDVLAGLQVEYTAEMERLQAEVWACAGREFNLGSVRQLGTVLFEEMGLPIVKRTKTGYSTSSDVLEKLRERSPIADLMLQWRKVYKLINTYTTVLQAAVADDGRVHACLQQTVGATGRLISTDPDLQRTPVRTGGGRRIREAFVAEAGHQIISADWSQIELRVLAHFSDAPRLTDAFINDLDVHARTAAELFEIAEKDVTKQQRDVGKTVNFATIYGQGANGLAQIVGVTRDVAAAYIERYFQTYAGVRVWLDETIEQGDKSGFVTTLLGRKRFIPELRSRNPQDRAFGLRVAANTPIQGSAADLCKLAMLAIDRELSAAKLKTRMLLQIHDELLFEAPDDEVEEATALIRRCMEQPLPPELAETSPLRIPLKVDIGHGPSWASAH